MFKHGSRIIYILYYYLRCWFLLFNDPEIRLTTFVAMANPSWDNRSQANNTYFLPVRLLIVLNFFCEGWIWARRRWTVGSACIPTVGIIPWCILYFKFGNLDEVNPYSSTGSLILIGYGFIFSLGVIFIGMHTFHQYLRGECLQIAISVVLFLV
jgi:hypothetical protein